MAAIGPLFSSYARLPEHFFARLNPTPVTGPRLILFNHGLAAELGLDVGALDEAGLAAVFGGNVIPHGAEPIAMAYAGHQFGHFVPQLGDGRAILLGEVRDQSGAVRDIQLKGSGRTPFSRAGDGRASLGPVLREYLMCEAMYALGVPATRALAAVMTGEVVHRERQLPGAVLTRVAASHVRVGTFEFFAARGDVQAVKRLADFVIERHYPEAGAAREPYLALLQAVVQRHARLVATWMQIGFIHGVMNTDNTSLAGETIDFGPCAFLDAYDPAAVFSSIDHLGRYAYANQPAAAQWNLARFAETLLPLLDEVPGRAVEPASAAVAAFRPQFDACWLNGMCRKIGLIAPEDGDLTLVRALLDAMHRGRADFTLTFRRLCDAADQRVGPGVRDLFAEPGAYDGWAATWRSRLEREPRDAALRATAMRQVNPAFIPRNHRIEQVINAAIENDDYSPFTTLLAVLSRPYEDQEASADFARPPQPAERVLQTFCGT